MFLGTATTRRRVAGRGRREVTMRPARESSLRSKITAGALRRPLARRSRRRTGRGLGGCARGAVLDQDPRRQQVCRAAPTGPDLGGRPALGRDGTRCRVARAACGPPPAVIVPRQSGEQERYPCAVIRKRLDTLLSTGAVIGGLREDRHRVSAGQRRWPGAGSNRRPSDFQRDDLCHPNPGLTCTDVADRWR